MHEYTIWNGGPPDHSNIKNTSLHADIFWKTKLYDTKSKFSHVVALIRQSFFWIAFHSSSILFSGLKVNSKFSIFSYKGTLCSGKSHIPSL